MSNWREQLKQLTPAQALRNEEVELIKSVENFGPSVAHIIIYGISKGNRRIVLDCDIDRKTIECIIEDMKEEWTIEITREVVRRSRAACEGLKCERVEGEARWVLFFTPKLSVQ
jgi:hypothetical protein